MRGGAGISVKQRLTLAGGRASGSVFLGSHELPSGCSPAGHELHARGEGGVTRAFRAVSTPQEEGEGFCSPLLFFALESEQLRPCALDEFSGAPYVNTCG